MALIADAIDTTTDLLTSALAFLGLRLSSRPADDDHHFGHEKMEILTSLIISFILFSSGLMVIWASWNRFLTGNLFEFDVVGIYASIISIAGKLFLSIILLEISAKIHSSSIKADAKNYRMDSLTSTGVLIAIIGAYFGFSILDLVVAFLVSLLIFKTAWGITREALAVLLDEAPAGLEKKVIEISKTVPGVINVHEFRARQLGGRRIIADCHIHVAHHISVDEAHKIMHNLEHAIYENTSITEILIHVEPDNQPC